MKRCYLIALAGCLMLPVAARGEDDPWRSALSQPNNDWLSADRTDYDPQGIYYSSSPSSFLHFSLALPEPDPAYRTPALIGAEIIAIGAPILGKRWGPLGELAGATVGRLADYSTKKIRSGHWLSGSYHIIRGNLEEMGSLIGDYEELRSVPGLYEKILGDIVNQEHFKNATPEQRSLLNTLYNSLILLGMEDLSKGLNRDLSRIAAQDPPSKAEMEETLEEVRETIVAVSHALLAGQGDLATSIDQAKEETLGKIDAALTSMLSGGLSQDELSRRRELQELRQNLRDFHYGMAGVAQILTILDPGAGGKLNTVVGGLGQITGALEVLADSGAGTMATLGAFGSIVGGTSAMLSVLGPKETTADEIIINALAEISKKLDTVIRLQGISHYKLNALRYRLAEAEYNILQELSGIRVQNRNIQNLVQKVDLAVRELRETTELLFSELQLKDLDDARWEIEYRQLGGNARPMTNGEFDRLAGVFVQYAIDKSRNLDSLSGPVYGSEGGSDPSIYLSAPLASVRAPLPYGGSTLDRKVNYLKSFAGSNETMPDSRIVNPWIWREAIQSLLYLRALEPQIADDGELSPGYIAGMMANGIDYQNYVFSVQTHSGLFGELEESYTARIREYRPYMVSGFVDKFHLLIDDRLNLLKDYYVNRLADVPSVLGKPDPMSYAASIKAAAPPHERRELYLPGEPDMPVLPANDPTQFSAMTGSDVIWQALATRKIWRVAEQLGAGRIESTYTVERGPEFPAKFSLRFQSAFHSAGLDECTREVVLNYATSDRAYNIIPKVLGKAVHLAFAEKHQPYAPPPSGPAGVRVIFYSNGATKSAFYSMVKLEETKSCDTAALEEALPGYIDSLVKAALQERQDEEPGDALDYQTTMARLLQAYTMTGFPQSYPRGLGSSFYDPESHPMEGIQYRENLGERVRGFDFLGWYKADNFDPLFDVMDPMLSGEDLEFFSALREKTGKAQEILAGVRDMHFTGEPLISGIRRGQKDFARMRFLELSGLESDPRVRETLDVLSVFKKSRYPCAGHRNGGKWTVNSEWGLTHLECREGGAVETGRWCYPGRYRRTGNLCIPLDPDAEDPRLYSRDPCKQDFVVSDRQSLEALANLNCTETGRLSISGEDITSLEGLNSIEITGGIELKGLPELKYVELNGLHTIRGDLSVNLVSAVSPGGFESLEKVEGNVYLTGINPEATIRVTLEKVPRTGRFNYFDPGILDLILD